MALSRPCFPTDCHVGEETHCCSNLEAHTPCAIRACLHLGLLLSPLMLSGSRGFFEALGFKWLDPPLCEEGLKEVFFSPSCDCGTCTLGVLSPRMRRRLAAEAKRLALCGQYQHLAPQICMAGQETKISRQLYIGRTDNGAQFTVVRHDVIANLQDWYHWASRGGDQGSGTL